MKLDIDVQSSPPSWNAINDTRNERRALRKKVGSFSTTVGLIALLMFFASYFYPDRNWMLLVFAVSMVSFIASHGYEKKLQVEDETVLGEVPASLAAQLAVYCQSTPAASSYKEAVIKERRAFIMAEYNAIQAHAKQYGSDEGMTALYGSNIPGQS